MKEHFIETLNREDPEEEKGEEELIEGGDEMQINVQSPSRIQVAELIRYMRRGRSASLNGLKVEVLKVGVESILIRIEHLFKWIW